MQLHVHFLYRYHFKSQIAIKVVHYHLITVILFKEPKALHYSTLFILQISSLLRSFGVIHFKISIMYLYKSIVASFYKIHYIHYFDTTEYYCISIVYFIISTSKISKHCCNLYNIKHIQRCITYTS